MSDLEMTELCAQAMGVPLMGSSVPLWNPLHNDAQAMALVKRFGLNIEHYYWDDPLVSKHDAHGKLLGEARNANLNRAIVECVAMMQASKTPAPPLP